MIILASVNNISRKLLLFFLLFLGITSVFAQELQDSVSIYFHQGKTNIDLHFRQNGQVLNHIRTNRPDSSFVIRKILIIGGASPEGSIPLNRWLSEQRAENLFAYIKRYHAFPDSLKRFVFLGRDWKGLLQLTENDARMPYRQETLDVLREIVAETGNGADGALKITELQQLHGGVPYNYMYREFFPDLRNSRIYVWYEFVGKSHSANAPMRGLSNEILPVRMLDTTHLKTRSLPAISASRESIFLGIKTNVLYDLLLIPNIGVEVYLGRNWSASANWMYAWWKSDRRHNYWRTYGGDVEIRRWFGKRAEEKPLTGHHAGVYGQIVTYDFELGGRGYLGDKWSYGAGISYGYALPVARRLNLDFTLAVGYLRGKYKEYLPIDDHYVWQSTRMRNWVGPTKLEVSLVWLIGRGNFNARKGGRS